MKRKLLIVFMTVCAALCCAIAFSACSGSKTVAVESVTLDSTSVSLTVGETYQLTATVSPDNATDKTVSWTSGTESVATVSDEGLVTAVTEGAATVTAAVGDKSATCTVTVSAADNRSYEEIISDALDATLEAANASVEIVSDESPYLVTRKVDYVSDSAGGVYYLRVSETSSRGVKVEEEGGYYVLLPYTSGTDTYYVLYEYRYLGAWERYADGDGCSVNLSDSTEFLNYGWVFMSGLDYLQTYYEYVDEITCSNGIYSISGNYNDEQFTASLTVSDGKIATVRYQNSDDGSVVTYAFTYGNNSASYPSEIENAVDATDYAEVMLEYGDEGYWIDLEETSSIKVTVTDELNTAEAVAQYVKNNLIGINYELVHFEDDDFTYTSGTLTESMIDTGSLSAESGNYLVKITVDNAITYIHVSVARGDEVSRFTDYGDIASYKVNEQTTVKAYAVYADGSRSDEPVDVSDYVTAIYKIAKADYSYGEEVTLSGMLSTAGVYMVYYKTSIYDGSLTVYVYDDTPDPVYFVVDDTVFDCTATDNKLTGIVYYSDLSYALVDLIGENYIISAYKLDSYYYYTGTKVTDYSTILTTKGIYYVTYGNDFYSYSAMIKVYDPESPEAYDFSNYILGGTYLGGYYEQGNEENVIFVYANLTNGDYAPIELSDPDNAGYIISICKVESADDETGTPVATLSDMFAAAGIYRITYGNNHNRYSNVIYVYDPENPFIYRFSSDISVNTVMNNRAYVPVGYDDYLKIGVYYVDGNYGEIDLTGNAEYVTAIYDVTDAGDSFNFDDMPKVGSFAEMFAKVGNYDITLDNGLGSWSLISVCVYNPADPPVVDLWAYFESDICRYDSSDYSYTLPKLYGIYTYADGSKSDVFEISPSQVDTEELDVMLPWNGDGNYYVTAYGGDYRASQSMGMSLYMYSDETSLTFQSADLGLAWDAESRVGYYDMVNDSLEINSFLCLHYMNEKTSDDVYATVYLTEDMLYVCDESYTAETIGAVELTYMEYDEETCAYVETKIYCVPFTGSLLNGGINYVCVAYKGTVYFNDYKIYAYNEVTEEVSYTGASVADKPEGDEDVKFTLYVTYRYLFKYDGENVAYRSNTVSLQDEFCLADFDYTITWASAGAGISDGKIDYSTTGNTYYVKIVYNGYESIVDVFICNTDIPAE